MKIDCIYIITLEELTDDYMQTLHYKIAQLGFPGEYGFHIFPAINGAKIPEDQKYTVYDKWKRSDTDYEYWNRDIALGEIGCTLSHINVWEDAYKAGLNNILVLEQDFMATKDCHLFPLEDRGPDWKEIFSIDCDIFNLGNFKANNDPGVPLKGKEHILKDGTFLNTNAYLVTNKRAIETLATSTARDTLIPADEFLPAITFPGHRRPDIRKLIEPKLTGVVYAKDEWPICQDGNHRTVLAGVDSDLGREKLRELEIKSTIASGERFERPYEEGAEGFKEGI